MKTFVIRNKNTGKTTYSGQFEDARACLEAAVSDRMSLAATDLRGFALAHANLDGGDFSGAFFDGSDLTDSNVSECNFTGASFRGVDLSLAALCESTLVDVDFTDASFAGTLLAGAVLEGCAFTCPSALTLDFAACRTLGRNYYGAHVFTCPPVVVTGLPKRLVFLDDAVLIGDTAYPRRDFPNPFENLFHEAQNAAIVPPVPNLTAPWRNW